MVPRQMLLTKTPCFPKRLCSIAIIDSFLVFSAEYRRDLFLAEWTFFIFCSLVLEQNSDYPLLDE